MPLPSDINLITCTALYLDMSGNPLSGSVTFTPVLTGQSAFNDPGDGAIVVPVPITGTLSQTGSLSVVLPCTDNTVLSPHPFTYTVVEEIAGAASRTYSISLPSSLGSSVNLASLAP
jgi:hypothetical protein